VISQIKRVFAQCAKIPTLAAASQAGVALRGETEPSRFAGKAQASFQRVGQIKRAPLLAEPF